MTELEKSYQTLLDSTRKLLRSAIERGDEQGRKDARCRIARILQKLRELAPPHPVTIEVFHLD